MKISFRTGEVDFYPGIQYNYIMFVSLTEDEIIQLTSLLKEQIKISGKKVRKHVARLNDSELLVPPLHQMAILVHLLDNYETTKKKEVIFLEEMDHTSFPATFVLGVLAEDWPGMSNSILGIVHHRKRNVLLMKGFSIAYKEKLLGLILIAFNVQSREEYEQFLLERKSIITEIKGAARGSTGKSRLLDDEAIKTEIYSKILRRIHEMHHNSDLLKVIEESGEVLKFVSSRSREYLEERDVKDLSRLVLDNYIFQNMIRSGETKEVVKIRNFSTKTEELTGFTFVCKENLFSIEDFLKTLEYIVPGHIIRHHKSYVTRDGILVYRIEIVDRNARPLEGSLIKSIEASMDKLITISCSKQFSKIKAVGGFEHYARAIIPFLTEELKRTKMAQVFINADNKTEFLINIKLVIVSYKSGKTHILNLISRLSQVPGIDIVSTIPPKIHSKRIAINILKLRVDLADFDSIKEIYSAIKGIVKKIYGDIRDFDEGFREIYIKILNQLLDQLNNVDASLVREIFFSIDELYKIEISPNLLLELIRLCSEAVEDSRGIPAETVLFKYKHIYASNRTVVVLSYVNHKRLLSRLVQTLKTINWYFTRIDWEQRSYLVMILSKNNCVVEDEIIEQLITKANAACFTDPFTNRTG